MYAEVEYHIFHTHPPSQTLPAPNTIPIWTLLKFYLLHMMTDLLGTFTYNFCRFLDLAAWLQFFFGF